MIVARVRRSIVERELIARGQRVLAACSGGPDSVGLVAVLARLARPLAIEVVVASVDHRVRPGSERDVEVARDTASKLSLPFHALALDLGPGSASLQARAREARYRALLELAEREGCARIAVGHTLDDQAETLLSRVLRGSGVAGLAGIEPRRADGVVRPLIDCRRAAVQAYVEHLDLRFAIDPSNQDPRFERARLRREVLPLLERDDPRIAIHLASIADEAREVAELVEQAGREWLARARLGADGVDLAILRSAPAAARASALAAWAREVTGRPPSRAHREGLEGLLRGRGQVRLGRAWVVLVRGDRAVAARRAAPEKNGGLRPRRKASDR